MQSRTGGRGFGPPGNFGGNLRGGLLDVSIKVLAGDHESRRHTGRAENNRRASAGELAAVGGGVHLVEILERTVREISDVHDDLQIGLALAKADDGAAQLIALVHFGEDATHEPAGGGQRVGAGESPRMQSGFGESFHNRLAHLVHELAREFLWIFRRARQWGHRIAERPGQLRRWRQQTLLGFDVSGVQVEVGDVNDGGLVRGRGGDFALAGNFGRAADT